MRKYVCKDDEMKIGRLSIFFYQIAPSEDSKYNILLVRMSFEIFFLSEIHQFESEDHVVMSLLK